MEAAVGEPSHRASHWLFQQNSVCVICLWKTTKKKPMLETFTYAFHLNWLIKSIYIKFVHFHVKSITKPPVRNKSNWSLAYLGQSLNFLLSHDALVCITNCDDQCDDNIKQRGISLHISNRHQQLYLGVQTLWTTSSIHKICTCEWEIQPFQQLRVCTFVHVLNKIFPT